MFVPKYSDAILNTMSKLSDKSINKGLLSLDSLMRRTMNYLVAIYIKRENIEMVNYIYFYNGSFYGFVSFDPFYYTYYFINNG